MLGRNLLALIATFVIALAWLRFMDFTAQRGWISSRLSRKIIHIGTGPIFVLCWLLFEDTPTARYLAALVPGAITLQFLLVGLGVIHDKAAVQAMSRNGDRREILRGPLYYGIVFVVITVLYWLETPVGIVALMMMCGGDGTADVIGRRFGRTALPWNRTKTLEGSLAVFVIGWLLSVLILWVFIAAGVFSMSYSAILWPITLIALTSMLIESLPLTEADNITVPLAALLVGRWLF